MGLNQLIKGLGFSLYHLSFSFKIPLSQKNVKKLIDYTFTVPCLGGSGTSFVVHKKKFIGNQYFLNNVCLQ